jgi:hypothetical protein
MVKRQGRGRPGWAEGFEDARALLARCPRVASLLLRWGFEGASKGFRWIFEGNAYSWPVFLSPLLSPLPPHYIDGATPARVTPRPRRRFVPANK